jgi:hypothetical protein
MAAPKDSWEREVEREAWMLQKEVKRAEDKKQREALREERRASDKLDREVAKLLRNDVGVTASADTRFQNSVSDDIVTDGAGLEWKWDEKTRWWWWLDEHGDWQGSGRSWTRFAKKGEAPPKKTEAKRGARRSSNASDAASESAASSVSTAASTAATLTWPKKEEKVVVQKQRPRAWDKSLVAVAAPAPAPALAPNPAPTPAPAAHADHSPVSTKPEGQSLSQMVATIRGELGLDDSLNMAQVIAEANLQLDMPAEGNLAKQASSLLREII